MSDSDDDLDALLGELDDALGDAPKAKPKAKPTQPKPTRKSSPSPPRRSVSPPSPPLPHTQQRKKAPPQNVRSIDSDDVDGLLDMMGDMDFEKPTATRLNVKSVPSSKSKCSPVVLVPPNSRRSSCKRMVCVGCDHEVMFISNKRWIESKCEYLFFRLNIPDVKKLSVNCESAPGTNAYCCQCTWRSVSEPEELSNLNKKHPRWMCDCV
jgi:hypothetical protein